MSADREETLSTWGAGDHESNAARRGDTVLKAAGPWTPTVIELLRHLEATGFDGAPRVVGEGLAADGRMTLSYVPGTSAHPRSWRDGACATIGALLRRAHDASATFDVPADAVWAQTWLRDLGDDDVVIGHRDAAPWNIVGRHGRPQTLIDWDLAGPVPRLTEVAYAAWLNAQLHDDDIAELHGLPDAAGRAKQARELVDGYELNRDCRDALVDRMIEIALSSARADAIEHHVTPESSQEVSPTGYPLLWSVTWRSRSAAWMFRHRRLLRGALTS